MLFLRTQHGFTLIELVIALTVGSLLMGGVYGVLVQQRNVYAMHRQMLEMRQNVRMGLDVMTNDIRMAGFDPTGNAGAGVVTAEPDLMRFTVDRDGSGTIGDAPFEDIAYRARAGSLRIQSVREKASGFQAVVDTIQRLRFCYVLPSNDPQAPCVPKVMAGQLQDIRAVRLTLIAKASRRDPQYPENDGYRTLERVVVVQLRNVALTDEPGW
jgi:type IV pilus assembly protein PilW